MTSILLLIIAISIFYVVFSLSMWHTKELIIDKFYDFFDLISKKFHKITKRRYE